MGTKKMVLRSGKKIAPPVSNKPRRRFNFIPATFVSPRGVITKGWTLPPDELDSLNDISDTDSDEEPIPYPKDSVGVNPHESVLGNSCDTAQQISAGRTLRFTTRRCKLNYLSKRKRQTFEHELVKKPASSVSRFNFIQATFVSPRGVITKGWTLPPDEMYSLKNDICDTDSDEEPIPYPKFGIGTQPSNPASAGDVPSKEQKEPTYSLASCIEDITKHVEVLKQQLLFSWITLTGALPHYTQKSGECWAAALSTGHAYYMAANNIDGERVTMELLLDGVPKEHLLASGGIDRIDSARDFMVDNNYVKDMIVHRRPSVHEEFDGYELLLEKLLAKGPMVVVFDSLPGYKDYDGKGIFLPDETEWRVSVYERYKQHSVVVTGCGVGLVKGKPTEFWQTHDSQESTWGVDGFGQLARRCGLIVAAVEFKF